MPSPLAAAFLLLLTLPATAQLQIGDLLVNQFECSTGQIVHYRPDGTMVASTSTGTGTCWEGAAITVNGQWATSRRTPNGVNLFDGNGAEVGTFDTTFTAFVPSDIAVFSDGTLAVGDQTGDVDLYTETGTYISTIFAPGMVRAFGLAIDSVDHLYVADTRSVGASAGFIWKFDQSGNLLLSLTTAYELGDLVVAPDDTLWCTDRNGGFVHHLAADGTALGSFPTLVSGGFSGIGLAPDGTLYCSGENASDIYHYDASGVLLDQFPLSGSGSPLFLTVVTEGGTGTNYCVSTPNSTGQPGMMLANGSASVAANYLTLGAQPVPAFPGLFYFGPNQTLAPFGNGFRCVGGFLTRLGPPAPPVAGVASRSVDLNALGIVPGTLHFQYWHRDPLVGTGFDLTDGLSIDFVP